MLEGAFKWTSASAATYENWHAGEPNDGGGEEDFVAIYNFESGGHQWNDFADIDAFNQFPLYGLVEIERGFSRWHREENPHDANGDSFVTPGDALVIINDLNANGARDLFAADGDGGPVASVDVSGDGYTTPLDALQVINRLNAVDHEDQNPEEGSAAVSCSPRFTLESTTAAEGDFLHMQVAESIVGAPVELTLENDGSVVYAYDPIEVLRDGELRIALPNVLRPGVAVDGVTLKVAHGLFRQQFQLEVREGLRMTVDDDVVSEGEVIPFHVRNGIGVSEVVGELLHDGNVIQEDRFETDGSGLLQGEFRLARHLLSYPVEVDGFDFRLTHGGKSMTRRIEVHAGLQLWTSAKNIREGHDFTIGGRNAVGNTAVYVEVHIDGREYDLTNANKDTNSDGSIDVTYTMPHGVIITGAPTDGAVIEVRTRNRVTGEEEPHEFRVTIHKGETESGGQTFPENIAPPPSRTDNSLIGLATLAVRGAADEELSSRVPAEVANDPTFLPTIREYSQPRGKDINLITWILLGMPREANAAGLSELYKPLTSLDRLRSAVDFILGIFRRRPPSPPLAPSPPVPSMTLVQGKSTEVLGRNPANATSTEFVADRPGHLGQDYGFAADAEIVSPVNGRVSIAKNMQGYGSLGVLVEVRLRDSMTFDSEHIVDGKPEPVTTDHLWILFGHLRPSRAQVQSADREARFMDGRHELSYSSTGESAWIKEGTTVLGYIEDWGPTDDPSSDATRSTRFLNKPKPGEAMGTERYFGKGTGPHLHVTISVENSAQKRLAGDLYSGVNLRNYINPETAWEKLRHALTRWPLA